MPAVTSPSAGVQEEKPPISMRELARFFFPLMRSYWKELFLAAVAVVLGSFFSVLRPWPLKVVVDLVITHRHHSRVPFLGGWLNQTAFTPKQIIYGGCAATILMAIVSGALSYYCTRMLGVTAQRYVFELRMLLFSHMQRLSLRFHDSQKTGDLTTRLTSDVQSIQDLIMSGVRVVGGNGLRVAGMLALMFWLDWRFALAAVSVVPLLFPLVFSYTRHLKRAARQARKSTGLMSALAQEVFTSIRIVQGLAQEDKIDERFEARSEGYLQAYLESNRYQARVGPLADLIGAIGITVVIWYGASGALSGRLSTGDVVVFFAYASDFFRPLRSLGRSSILYNRAIAGTERIVEVMNVESELKDRTEARPAPRFRGKIEFRDVSFEYVPGSQVLSHINLKLAPGEKIAIVGGTGAGKSTMVSLILRFYDANQGAVHIDSQDVRNYRLTSLREQISLVLQDSLLFSGTIRENINFGCPGASEEAIAAAARIANADEFIQCLPHGYDTVVSERATTLSGGQKQRIAIARAVLRDAPIVILDEPTTGLDAASERFVLDALEHAMEGRTAIVIAHRLATVRLVDRIIVLDHGRIIEQGTHTELLVRNGAYARLYRLQTSVGPEMPLDSIAVASREGQVV